MFRSVFVALMGLTVVGGSVRADEIGGAVAPAPRQLRFTLDQKTPQATVSAADQKSLDELRASVVLATRARLAQEKARLAQSEDATPTTTPDWNCGMPVIAPSRTPDPGIAHEVAERGDVTFHIKRAKPQSCGR